MIQYVLGIEVTVLPGLLMAAVLWHFLAGRIPLRGLLRAKDRSRRISWARAQLLLVTLLTAGYLAVAIWTSPRGRFPGLSSFWIYLMAVSSAIYLVREACRRAVSNSDKEAV